jgi:uroporphyrinogen-III synthase
MQAQTLAGRTIAVPESRELDVFSSMLERRGATVLRCPLVSILDAPDPRPVLDWLCAFNRGEHDDLILLTGEGLRRLLSCIDTNQPALRAAFLEQLARVRKITRGPKPARVLRELGLKSDIAAQTPTTDGVIASLRGEPLAGRNVAVQLYGTDPNRPLVDFLNEAGAHVSTVAPYIYADQTADEGVRQLLTRMAAGDVDVIAFTSTPQVERLFAVGPIELVRAAVVAQALARHDVDVRLMPRDSFFMKPLASAMEEAIGPLEQS